MVGRSFAPIFSTPPSQSPDRRQRRRRIALVGQSDRDIELFDSDPTRFAGDDVIVGEDEAVAAHDHA